MATPTNLTWRTRRTAVVIAFIPIIAIYLLYTFKAHTLIPTVSTWPIQRQVIINAKNMMRHRLWPWTIEMDSKRHSFTRHIVAVGDIHGDLPNAKRVLDFSGVVDEFGDWSGDVDFFVQTGDIIDRGDDTILLFDLMDRLRSQALHAGGMVLTHLGNHEWMNAMGDWRFVYLSEIETFGSIAARQRMLSTGRIGRSWANNYTTASRLPLHPSMGPPNTPYPPVSSGFHFQTEGDVGEYTKDPMSHAALSFVHGGLSPTYPDLSPFPTRINALSDSLLAKVQHRRQPPPHPPNPFPGLPSDATQEEERLLDSDGPLWYRGWAYGKEETVCKEVEQVLAVTGTRRMIMGHTLNLKHIVSRCGGKIILIDTGITHAYGGVLSALSIYYTLTPIGDHTSQRWREKEVVSALYPDRREVLAVDEREIVGKFLHDNFDQDEVYIP